MQVGQTVYTIDNLTNTVDSWEYAGSLRTEKELLIRLRRGRESCFLPARCVFESEFEAKFVADSYQ